MLKALTSANCRDNAVDTGVEEVDAAADVVVEDAVTADAAANRGRGDKLDDGRLCVAGRRPPRAPCTVEKGRAMPTSFNDAGSAGKSSFDKELNGEEFHGTKGRDGT